MSITSVGHGTTSAIWGSAANALSSPTPSLSGFKTSTKAAAEQPKPAQRVSDATQDGLRQVQEAAHQAGAFATNILQALAAYRPR